MISDFRFNNSFLLQLVYVVLLPLSFLGGALLYDPFDIQEYYTIGSLSFDFHLVILACIILVTTLVTRTFLFFILKRFTFNLRQYEVWCFGEMLIVSAFVALYTCLVKGVTHGYLIELQTSGKFVLLVLCFPYLFLTLIRIIRIKSEDLDNRNNVDDKSLVRFYDEHKRLKLNIAPSSILYVKSEFNYVKIHYLDAGKVKKFILRASMRSLEKINNKCLVRCQRSYFVNPERISVLRKDSEGFIFAELNIPDVPAVPVSKQYYDSLAALL